MNETKDKIKDMLSRIADLTATDKATIKQMCRDAELDVKFNGRCKNCYIDALIALKNHYGIMVSESGESAADGEYSFVANGRVIWYEKGIRRELSAATDKATIERFVKANPRQKYFVKKGGGND